jgi:prepilin-type N-terminal cleavage/methylation domain-containing protein
MINNRWRKGFTLVELTLAMAFLSILLLAILFSTIHIGKLYTKGVTNRQINQIGRELVDTIQRDFLTADAASIDLSALASNRACIGGVSYVWNPAALLHSGAASDLVTDNNNPVTFTRLDDRAYGMCTKADGKYPMDITALTGKTNLLDSEGRSLAVYSMNIMPIAQQDNAGLYEIKITVGTNDTSAMDTSATAQCKPQTDNSSDFSYCGVTNFDIIVRAGGDNR